MSDKFSMDSLEDPRLDTAQVKQTTLLCLLFTAMGITAGIYASMVGHSAAYGISREIPWGILISSYSFFALTASGLAVFAVLSHFYGLQPLAPLHNRAVYLAIVSIVAGFMLITLATRNPWRMLLYNMTSPNLTSNIWWMGTLYGIMIGCMFLRFVAVLTDPMASSLASGIIGALAGVGANNNMGATFTTMADPPLWYGPQLPIFFLASAVLCGTAAVIICTHFAYAARGEKISPETFTALKSASTIMALMISLLMVVTASRFISLFIGEPEPGRIAALALMKGPLARHFWVLEIFVGLVLPLFLLAVTKVKNVEAMSIAAIMALIGAFFQRYNLVLSGQIIPKFSDWNNGPTYLHYSPSFVELLVVFGALALTIAGVLLGERFLGRIFHAQSTSRSQR